MCTFWLPLKRTRKNSKAFNLNLSKQLISSFPGTRSFVYLQNRKEEIFLFSRTPMESLECSCSTQIIMLSRIGCNLESRFLMISRQPDDFNKLIQNAFIQSREGRKMPQSMRNSQRIEKMTNSKVLKSKFESNTES